MASAARIALLTILLSANATTTSFAAGLAPSGGPFAIEDCLDDAALDGLRGGFVTSTGLQIAFGIQRAVYIDGNLITTTTLNVADSSALGTVARTMGSIQSGPNNAFDPGPMAASSVTTVIQNSLDNRMIQGVTVVNATVNSLETTKRSALTSSLQGALTGSVRR